MSDSTESARRPNGHSTTVPDRYHGLTRAASERVARQAAFGAVAAALMAAPVVLSSIVLSRGNTVGALVGVVALPFAVALLASRSVVDALVLTWLNEIFFGMSGAWVRVGPVPGRGALLLVVVGLYAVWRTTRPGAFRAVPPRALIVVCYGVVIPVMLWMYAVAVKQVSAPGALADVMRFGTLLIYFPLAHTSRRNVGLCLGWTSAATVVLGMLIVTAATGPLSLRDPLSQWLNSMDPMGVIARSDEAFTRVAITPAILCYLGVFLGLVIVSDSTASGSRRCIGGLLAAAALAPLVVNFVRGQLLGVAGGFAFLLLLNGAARLNWRNLARLLALAGVLSFAGYWVSTSVITVSLTKWDIRGLDWREIVDPVRIEQTERMLGAWLQAPLLGQGVGAPVWGYSRTGEEGGLAYEVQFPMVLYRVGLIGFVVLMAPFVWLVARTVRLCRGQEARSQTVVWQLQSSVACSVVALLTAAWMNPYLATVFTPFLFALFLAADDARVQRRAAQGQP